MIKKCFILAGSVIFFQVFSAQTASAGMLSDMTLGDGVSLHDRFALIDNVALGDGFALVDQSKGLKIGNKVTIRPMSRVQLQYDSNVFLAENDEKGDWTTTFDVGAEAEMKMGKVNLIAGYVFGMNRFFEYENQNSNNHTAIAKADWELANFDIIVGNKFKKFSDRSGTEETRRIARKKNILSADVITTKLGKVGFDSGYDFIVEDYTSNELLTINGQDVTYREAESRREHVLREEFTHRTFPKTSLVAEADGGVIEYKNDYRSDSYFLQGLAGLKGEVFKESVATLKVGYRYQDYDKAGYKDFSGIVLRGSISKKFGVKNTVSSTVERSVDESVYDNMNYYVLNHAGLGYVYQHNDKLSAHFAGSFQRNQYPTETTEDGITAKRHDDIYMGACGLRYDVRQWLTAAASYQFTERRSRFDSFDYVDHLFSLSAAVQF
jgi:hypothetical protein